MSLRKPYRSVDEQLRILRSRGMAVDAGAGHVLRREGYYPIVNGYKDLFLDRKECLTAGDDRYGTGARFDDLYALFLFDRELRELLFSAITRAEAALTRTCTRPSVILAICLTRTITWNCSVASPHWSHGRPPPCHSGLSAIGLWDSGWIWDAIGGWDGCMGRVSFCLLSAMETCCRANASAPPMRNIMKPQGVLHFSVPVGEDAERRQGGGTFPDYFWVPVGASWKTRLIGRFPKN